MHESSEIQDGIRDGLPTQLTDASLPAKTSDTPQTAGAATTSSPDSGSAFALPEATMGDQEGLREDAPDDQMSSILGTQKDADDARSCAPSLPSQASERQVVDDRLERFILSAEDVNVMDWRWGVSL